MNKLNIHLCILGNHELDYPRNQAVIQTLKSLGVQTHLCHSRTPFPIQHFILLYKYIKCFKKVNAIWVTEGGHRLVPFLKIFSTLTGKKIIFDPFTSRYNTRIEDRKLYKKYSFQSFICKWQDWSSTHMADILVFDTKQHQAYFYKKYNLNKKYGIFPLGTPNPIQHTSKPISQNKKKFQVLFYGNYIPLQGIDILIEAAKILKEKPICFKLIGKGQTFQHIKQLIKKHKLTHVTQLPPQPFHSIQKEILQADLCMGIFDKGIKAQMVVPNKVVQVAALGTPLVSGETPALKTFFTSKKNIYMVEPGNSQALAQTILYVFNHPKESQIIGLNGQKIYQSFFSPTALSHSMENILHML